MNLQPRGNHRARSPSLLRQARDKDLQNSRTAQAQTPIKKSSKHVLAGKYKSKRLRNMRLRTWLGVGWSCASACGWARRGAMPMGFEPSWSSDRTALCARQRAPLYATHALGLSVLAGRPRGSCRSISHVLLSCVLVRLGTSYYWTCRSVAIKHAGGQGPARRCRCGRRRVTRLDAGSGSA